MIRFENGAFYEDEKPLTQKEITALKEDAYDFMRRPLFKKLLDMLRWQAEEYGFYAAEKWDDTVKGQGVMVAHKLIKEVIEELVKQ